MADINFADDRDKSDMYLEGASSPVGKNVQAPQLSDADEKILAKAYLKLDFFFLTIVTCIYWLNFLGESSFPTFNRKNVVALTCN
jgi:hypothetical protein